MIRNSKSRNDKIFKEETAETGERPKASLFWEVGGDCWDGCFVSFKDPKLQVFIHLRTRAGNELGMKVTGGGDAQSQRARPRRAPRRLGAEPVQAFPP